MPSKPGSPFASLEGDDAWVAHRDEMDAAFRRLQAGPVPEMRAFQRQELNTPAIARAVAFYPFSGPDALILTTFFPRSPVYVMVGLEPPGTLPTPRRLEKKHLAEYFAEVRTTLGSELGRSFFITRQMDRQFRGQVTDGLFLPIAELLVRTNHTISGYRYLYIDDAGRLAGRPEDGKFRNKGIQIDFLSGDGSAHKLIYLSVNLDDKHLRENQPFLKFLSAVDGATTYLKATSYMLHHVDFSIIRGQILEHSGALLQDDSGIPYRYFVSPWRVQLFGEYTRPYGSFRWLEQADLRQAYQTSGPKPLTFRIGYGYGRVPSNLLLATR